MTTRAESRAFPQRSGILRPRQARNSKLFVRKVKRPFDMAPCSGNIPTRRYGRCPNRRMCAISSGGEHHLDTVGVASSNLASRTTETRKAPSRVPFLMQTTLRAPAGHRFGRCASVLVLELLELVVAAVGAGGQLLGIARDAHDVAAVLAAVAPLFGLVSGMELHVALLSLVGGILRQAAYHGAAPGRWRPCNGTASIRRRPCGGQGAPQALCRRVWARMSCNDTRNRG